MRAATAAGRRAVLDQRGDMCDDEDDDDNGGGDGTMDVTRFGWWMDVMNGDEQLIPVGRRPKARGGRGVTQRQPGYHPDASIDYLPTGERQPPGWNLDGQPASPPNRAGHRSWSCGPGRSSWAAGECRPPQVGWGALTQWNLEPRYLSEQLSRAALETTTAGPHR